MITWTPIATFARQWNKHTGTVRRWVISGFIFKLEDNFYVKRDPHGQIYIGKRHSAN